jgi:hypothetical protein
MATSYLYFLEDLELILDHITKVQVQGDWEGGGNI